jgi:shikimate kinase
MWTSFVGFMGSGKSTLARHLQRATGRPAIDLDQLIAEQAGAPIGELIAERGLPAFRRLESEALAGLPADRDLLLAVGGGCVEVPTNVATLRRAGVVIWLDAAWEVLRSRIAREAAGGDRPLLAQLGWHDLATLHRRRRRLYAAAADFRLRSDRQPIAATGRSALLKSLLWRRRQWGRRE